jgi:hypothetical protein
MIDEKIEKERILSAWEQLGVDIESERFRTEMAHLMTLFAQQKTVAEALASVGEGQLRQQLKPSVYYMALRSLILAATRLQAITPEQGRDLDGFLLSHMDGLMQTVFHQH